MKNVIVLLAAFALLGCNRERNVSADVFDVQRHNMVRFDLRAQGIQSDRVLAAMSRVPRHLFLPAPHRHKAYQDTPLPIAPFVETPRPFVVAKAIELLKLKGTEKVLEVGTGRGYQSALLGELAAEVFTIEIVPDLGQAASKTLKTLQYENVHVRIGDGFGGWPEHQPFDAILVMAAGRKVPEPLLEQLAIGGRLVMPMIKNEEEQTLVLYRKTRAGLKQETIMPVTFQPLEGHQARQKMGL